MDCPNNTEKPPEIKKSPTANSEAKPAPRPETVRQVLRAFVASSSVKGASKVLNSKTTCQRILWSLTVITGLTITTCQLYLLFSAYFRYDTTITTQETPDIMPFPDISVCNLNPLAANETQELYLQWSDTILLELRDLVFTQNVSTLNGDNYDNLTYEQLIFMHLSDSEGFWQNANHSYDPMLKDQLRQFIRICVWDQWKFTLAKTSRQLPQRVECEAYSFTHMKYFFDQHYGPCVTFSLSDSFVKNMRAFTGVFYVQDIEGGSTWSYAANADVSFGNGVKVLVHSRDTLPNMADAIAAPTGYETTLFVNVVERRRLDEPHGMCTSRDTLPGEPAYVYNFESCQSLCGQFHAIDTCGCLDYDEVISPTLKQKYNFCGKIFDDFNDTIDKYECGLYHYSINRHSSCDCLPPCEEYKVNIRASQTVWPHKMHTTSFFSEHIFEQVNDYERFIIAPTTTFLGNVTANFARPDYELLRHNFLQINIKLHGMNTTLIADKEAMTINGVVSSIGGILNLWIGISFVTIVEFSDVMYQLARSKYKDWKEKHKTKPDADDKWAVIKHKCNGTLLTDGRY